PFYLVRMRSGWQYVSLLLALGHFALPFCLLLSRDLKRHPRLLARVALFILAMRLLDLIWIVAPNFNQNGFPIHWMDVAIPVGLAYVSMWAMMRVLDKIEARNDPQVSPLAAPAGELPPEPRLQTTPWADLRVFRAAEDKALSSYGWIDQKNGVAYMPIEKAKE